MRITITSVPVDDQEKALRFYTEKLGFLKKNDIPIGAHRWLTVVSKEQPDGVELLLEPMGFEPARVYQRELFNAGIPYTMFQVADIEGEHQRLTEAGVHFFSAPQQMGNVIIAVLDDTCGNRIQLVQMV
jgi:predicted enzyme related to lactoylglutathione lyase